MKKMIYLDTSFISFLYDDRPEFSYLKERTQEWWNDYRLDYELYISDQVLLELSKGNYSYKDSAIRTATNIENVQITNDIIDIAKIYIQNRLMPKQLEGDALHLACASFYAHHFLLTWNYKHLANVNKKEHIRIINTRLRLYTPDIITPLELLIDKEE